jgi:putative heme-binding domain-containing protein
LHKSGCIACHRLGAVGTEVGPDLATVGGKPPAQLIEAIFDPNRAVEQRYTVTTFVLEDGTVASGLVVADAPDIWVYNTVNLRGLTRRVQGYSFSPVGSGGEIRLMSLTE